MILTICKNPFRVFFPIAITCFLYGCGLWISFGLFEIGEFPLQKHVNLFIGGFLYFSILGFLLTAIPRFTLTDFMSIHELFTFIGVAVTTLAFYLFQNQTLFWLSISFGWASLIVFGAKRFLKRKQNPPFTFIFVGLGVTLGLVGSSFHFLVNFESEIFSGLEIWGKIFFYDGMITSFILGVGGRLIPGIFGFVEIVKDQRKIYESPRPFFKMIPKKILIYFFIFVIALFLEGMGFEKIGQIIKAIVITYFSFKYWRLHERIQTGKWHGKMLKLSCFFILISSWALCFFFENVIHIKHLIYIGSYCLMTIMVASRVIVAHGHDSLEIEHKKMPYLVVGSLIVLAAATRGSAYLMPDSYIRHLGYAAFVLFVAGIIWGLFFSKKIFFLKDGSDT